MESTHSLLKASQQLNPQCPICNVKYDMTRIQVLEENETGVLSHFSCKKCAASFLATVVETPLGHVASGLLTDLQAEEVLDFADQDTVTNDNVIEMHEMLDDGTLMHNVLQH